MINFKEITPEDRSWVQPLLDQSGYRLIEYNFTFMYLWREIFQYRIGQVEGYLVLKSQRENHPITYLFPAGSGDLPPVLEALDQDAASHGIPLIFHMVPREGRELLEEILPHEFEFIELTDFFDYIYESSRMQRLNGKKLSGKRNHINRFKEEYPNWVYERITPENIHEVVAMNQKWVAREEEEDPSRSFAQEALSVDEALEKYEELGLTGGLLRGEPEGEVMAYTIGDRLTEDTLLIHIEKAFRDIQGAYPMINQQFALDQGKEYTYINREDDSGNPGLRRAKRSYQPIFMGEKYGAKRFCDDAQGGRGDGKPCYE